jgi:hypothetical protein
VGKGVDGHSLPVVAIGSIPYIYRRADCPLRATPAEAVTRRLNSTDDGQSEPLPWGISLAFFGMT